MSRITLEQANTFIGAVLAEGKAKSLKPLGVAVVDAGGHLIAFQRQDGAPSIRPLVAQSKAAGALSMGVSSRRIAEMAVERPTFIASLAAIAPHGITPAAGGVIVVGDDGHPIGAVGVTGDTSDNDEAAALVGIAAAGLKVQG
jgi:uncharacterized protein GlcG (DUF336 family)